MPTEIPITKKRGDTRPHIFTIKDASGTVVNINSWTEFSLVVDPSPNPTDSANNVETMTGSFVTDGTDGKVQFPPAAATPIGVYFYDAQAKDDNSDIVTFVEGQYTVSQDINKAT